MFPPYLSTQFTPSSRPPRSHTGYTPKSNYPAPFLCTRHTELLSIQQSTLLTIWRDPPFLFHCINIMTQCGASSHIRPGRCLSCSFPCYSSSFLISSFFEIGLQVKTGTHILLLNRSLIVSCILLSSGTYFLTRNSKHLFLHTVRTDLGAID